VSAIRDVTLETFARENAVDGCVRETYGALLATYQARSARDPEVRRAMKQIARDETRHAAIAWAIARWVEPKLDAGTRARVREARRTAVGELHADLNREAPTKLRQIAGVPSSQTARTMVRALARELWVQS
jgi:rubrerythrin